MGSAEDLRQDFETLASIGAVAEGGISRPAFSPEDCQAHDWFLDRARSAGLQARYDPFGNAIATLLPRDPALSKRPAVLIGSHLDTVKNGGAFDGALGVLVGLDVLRRMTALGGVVRPVEVVAFRDEEGRFGPFTGSRAFTGTLPLDRLDQMRSPDNEMLGAAMRRAGFNLGEAATAALDMPDVAAYLEIHIEQGAVLEREGCSLGVVTSIVGQERMALRFIGQADHAGTTPMDLRRDAFAAAARFADRFRQSILEDSSPTLRGTVGIVKVMPNQGNVVPDEVRMGLEIRDADAQALRRSGPATAALAEQIAAEFNVECKVRPLLSEAPVAMDERLRLLLEQAATKAGARWMTLVSGANHDAGVMARFVPTAMLFVPSTGGRSHCPQEHTDWHHVEQGVAVLEAVVRQVAGMEAAPAAIDEGASN